MLTNRIRLHFQSSVSVEAEGPYFFFFFLIMLGLMVLTLGGKVKIKFALLFRALLQHSCLASCSGKQEQVNSVRQLSQTS